MPAHARPILAYGLAALGSVLWLVFLVAGVEWLVDYGLYQSSGAMDQGVVLLLLVPLAMIAGTVALGYRSARMAVPVRVIMASSVLAVFALLLCLGSLGRGV